LRCAKSISTFLRSLRDCLYASVLVRVGLGNVASDIACRFMDAARDLPSRCVRTTARPLNAHASAMAPRCCTSSSREDPRSYLVPMTSPGPPLCRLEVKESWDTGGSRPVKGPQRRRPNCQKRPFRIDSIRVGVDVIEALHPDTIRLGFGQDRRRQRMRKSGRYSGTGDDQGIDAKGLGDIANYEPGR
jgi:hypothetical protein